ncbi:XRCC4-like factor-domain-containing protein [Aspergillus egyptiacus]|nr:XRCC4-like factor-domain-containing protein [Aspergillus egyptiacus]
MSGKWRRLRLSNQGDIPPVLFRYSSTASGYDFYMTDLNYIWSECLHRETILERADEEETTIDPSEDSEQFKVLLQKIGEGLQNEPGSKIVLNPRPQGKAQALELIVTSKLPAPLKPLRWRLSLTKESQPSTTGHLLVPFMRAEVDREARQRSLIEEINKKDWVLAKLFDKIDALGIDLSTIFPGTSGLRAGRKGPTLAQAAKYIRGLAPFDEKTWLEEVSESSPASGLAASIVAEISGDPQFSGQLDSLNPSPDGWWEKLTVPKSPTSPSNPQRNDKKLSKAKPPTDAMETESDPGAETTDDEFERQEKPPRLKKPSDGVQKPPSLRTEEDETQSENEPTSPPKGKQQKGKTTEIDDRPPPAMRPKKPPAGNAKGLGTIGGKKQPKQKDPSPSPPKRSETSNPSPSSREENSPVPPAGKEDETTDDEEADRPYNQAQTRSKSPKPQSTSPEKPAPKRRGLGVIGGKKKVPEPEPEREKSQSQSQSRFPEPQSQSKATQSDSKQKKPHSKLGVIGGSKAKTKPSAEPPRAESISPPTKETQRKKKNRESVREDDTESEPETKRESTSATSQEQKVKNKVSAEPEREETEQERADRKREELKRQLEAKSKAPVKKKRRF